MACPKELKYTKEHVWVRLEGNEAVVGITDFAQAELGDVVFVELPNLEMEVEQNASFLVVESTKAASDIYAPIAGIVIKINEALNDTPNLVNNDPYGEGWLVRLSNIDISALDSLLSAEEYEALIA